MEIIMLAKPCHSFALMALRIHAILLLRVTSGLCLVVIIMLPFIDLWAILRWRTLSSCTFSFRRPKNALSGFCAFEASRSASFQSSFFIRLTSGLCLFGNHYCILPLAFGSCLGGRLCPRVLFLSVEPKAHF